MLIVPLNPALAALAGTTQTARQVTPGQAQNEIRRPAKPVEKKDKSNAQNPRYHRAGADSDGQMHADLKV